MENKYERIRDIKEVISNVCDGSEMYIKYDESEYRLSMYTGGAEINSSLSRTLDFKTIMNVLNCFHGSGYYRKSESPQIFDHTDVWFDMGFRRIDSKEILVHTLTNICTDRVCLDRDWETI